MTKASVKELRYFSHIGFVFAVSSKHLRKQTSNETLDSKSTACCHNSPCLDRTCFANDRFVKNRSLVRKFHVRIEIAHLRTNDGQRRVPGEWNFHPRAPAFVLPAANSKITDRTCKRLIYFIADGAEIDSRARNDCRNAMMQRRTVSPLHTSRLITCWQTVNKGRGALKNFVLLIFVRSLYFDSRVSNEAWHKYLSRKG